MSAPARPAAQRQPPTAATTGTTTAWTTEPVAPGALADTLGHWTAREGPTYIRLAGAIADAIAQGHLGLGARLPSERTLAAHLRVARGTVVAAYDALRARGVVRTRRGSGTTVQSQSAPARAHRAPLLSRLVDGGGAAIDLAIATVQLAPDEIPDIRVRMRHAAQSLPAHGYAPLGMPALRAALADRFTACGMPTRPDQILITNGGQGALSVTAAALLSTGDRVLMEAPTYPAAIESFVRAGARVQGVERDHAGPGVTALEQALAFRPARLIYLIPTCHNPTGGVMSEGRRLAVLRRAREARALVVEDAVTEDLLLTGEAPPSLAALDPRGVLTIGSLSKIVWGGLRVGWIRASSELILRLGRVKAALDLGSPALEQVAALEILDRYDELAAARRAIVRRRLDTLCEELERRLPEWSFAAPRGGLAVWVGLPSGSADDVAQLALRRGVAIAAGRSASPGEEFLGHLRICAGPPPELIVEGVARVAEAWRELHAMPATARGERILV
jgi:DNA-binding transcriptional MocR family regulator